MAAERITSRANPLMPHIRRLSASRSYRRETGEFLGDGVKLLEEAARDGFPVVLDGGNASDDAGDRPGMRALAGLGIRSPLRECGIGKAEVRRMAREAGLRVWDKPSYACLATRVPAGTAVSAAALARVERGETALMALGFSDLRLRLRGEDGLLQVRGEQLELARRLLTAGSADPAAARDELLHTMACKAAIKGGWRSAQEELEAVARAVLSGAVKYCPHGRPVAIELTKKQLEKQFKRS